METLCLGVFVALVLLAVPLVVNGARARARLKAQHPPVGQLVDVGGYRLHLDCRGEGSPAVVLEAGQGDFGLTWALVQPQIAEFARVCAYDRAGLGWSDPSPRPRTVEVMVDELRTLLLKAGVPGPYVLVGHSFGALIVRLFAHEHPADVAGMVLVDPAHEEQFSPEPIQKTLKRMAWMMPLMFGAFQGLVRSGIAAMKPSLLPVQSWAAPMQLSEQDSATYQALVVSDAKHLAASGGELKALSESHAQMRAAGIDTLGDLPLIVLRHGQPSPMMASPEVAQLLEETTLRLQEEVAGMSSRGTLAVVEDSGHLIHHEQPARVIQAIRDVLAMARQPSGADVAAD